MMKKVLFIFMATLIVINMMTVDIQAKIVFKVGHVSPLDSLEGKAVQRFIDLVRQRTNGEIEIEHFPSEQLGKAMTMIQNTAMGDQDMVNSASVEYEQFLPDLRVIGLSFILRDFEHYRKLLHSQLWQEMFVEPMEKKGLKFLCTQWNWERGPFRVMVSTKPVNSIEDVKGLRLRIAPIETWKRTWEAFGARTIVVPWTDAYLALRQKMVDAVTAPFDLVWAMKFTEVAKYVIRTDEQPQLLMLVMHINKFNSLKPEWQKTLIDACNEAGTYHRQLSDKAVVEDLEKMKKEHGVTYTTLDTAPFRARMQKLVRELENEGFLPKGVYDKVQAIK